MNIPLYRAKKIDSDEYVIGYLKPCTYDSKTFWIQTDEWLDYKIDPSTLSISFEGMKDSEDTRIFASLAESGKGGDILLDNLGDQVTFKYAGKVIGEENFGDGFGYYGFNLDLCSGYPAEIYTHKVTGIQE